MLDRHKSAHARPARRLAAAAALVVVLVACSVVANEVEVASGDLQSGPWSAWVYDSLESGVCLEVRRTEQAADRICDLTPDFSGTWRPSAADGDDELVAGTTVENSAERVVVTLAGGDRVGAEVRTALDISPLRFFALTIPAEADATQVDVLDGDGRVLDSLPLE